MPEFLEMNLSEKEQSEIEYWRKDGFESSKQFTALNFLTKTQQCHHLDYKIKKYLNLFKNKNNILEVGAGQGWASCYLKKFYLPNAHFTVTDISPYALESLHYWEQVFQISIDEYFEAKSYQISAPDQSFDLIFCYRSAHHFVLYEETLADLKRLLKKDGVILFLYEPTCSRLLYPIHKFYVNKIPHSSPEDVIVPSNIKQIANKLRLNYFNYYDAHQTIHRGGFQSLYFRFLKTFKFLQPLLPSSSDLVFSIKN